MTYMTRQNVGLDRESHEYLDRFVADRGIVKASLVSNLVKWWGRQDSMTQHILVGLVPEHHEGAIALTALAQLIERAGADPATEAQFADLRARLDALHARRPQSKSGKSPDKGGPAGKKGGKP